MFVVKVHVIKEEKKIGRLKKVCYNRGFVITGFAINRVYCTMLTVHPYLSVSVFRDYYH